MKFNMNISPVDDCVWLNEDCTLLIDGDTPEEAANAAQALNDSCRLAEENAKLREVLLDLLECKGILTSDKECVINARNLLKDQNNDK